MKRTVAPAAVHVQRAVCVGRSLGALLRDWYRKWWHQAPTS